MTLATDNMPQTEAWQQFVADAVKVSSIFFKSLSVT